MLKKSLFWLVKYCVQNQNTPLDAILMLHRIAAPDENGIWYNQHLKLSSKTIEEMAEYARSRGCEFVSLNEITRPKRLWEKRRKLIAITLDDGYRDNFTNGAPTFKKLNIPYTIYVCTKMVEGKMLYWWEILEKLVLEHDEITLNNGLCFDCSTKEKKEQSFLDIREVILKLPQDNLERELIKLFEGYDIDINVGNDSLGLSWEQIKELSKDPLCTLGNHTYSHKAFRGCSDKDIIEDIERANKEMESHTGIKMTHFAFPFGESSAVSQHDIDLVKNLGFCTSATTNHGLVNHKTDNLELPRIFVTEQNWKEMIDYIANNCQ